ncbi:hypothetical protein BJ170DRAFT_101298 [Xylariales sp. AK1849]|nr:hypothetical protein BJ170DRAFT_101298 [Xylariales sp. AK1849]
MTRPQIIRADSIDLQDQDNPSAQDHATLTNGQSLAPHQAETLREVAAETREDRRISWTNGDIGDTQQYAEDVNGSGTKMQQQDALAIAQNGGVGTSEDGEVDADGDSDLDDDMMDKISSSPSIEDGVYNPQLPPLWPARVDSLYSHIPSCDSPSSLASSDPRSSSPYLERPEYLPLPLQLPQRQSSKASAQTAHPHHHLTGEYTGPDHDGSTADTTRDPNRDPNRDPTPCDDPADQGNEAAKEREEDVRKRTVGHDALSRPMDFDVQVKIKDFSLNRSPSIESLEFEHAEPEDPISPYNLLIPYDCSEDDDDDDDGFSLIDDSRFVDSGWGGECLQVSEDIDFEFVYALHTFVATVEGQANATKGDTMVLLDDSNSYWWLVRVVKDSSIGYLPAEHIETPTERLARLNKHRNIDLSATMLGDTAEKAKNPIKTAMRRRKAKGVTFAPPTYVDYSDFDYSTDEEDPEGEQPAQQQASQQETQQKQQQAAQPAATEAVQDDESAKVEPLKPRTQQKQVKIEPTAKDEDIQDEGIATGDDNRNSDEMFDNRSESRTRTTRNGTVRNTDSFFKDETVETKKITLTPNLLRDDNGPRESNSSDLKDLRQRPSFDKLEKELVSDKSKDKKRDKEKKEKDKKSSGIRGFFSRKDKKKSADDDDESFGKRSLDAGVDVAEEETQSIDREMSPDKASGPQRNPSKLQKQQPRVEPSPTRKTSNAKETQPGIDLAQFLTTDGKPINAASAPSASLRMVESEPLDTSDRSLQKDEKSRSGMSKILHPNEGRPPKVSKAKSRVELDDFDSSTSEEAEVTPQPSRPAPTPELSRQAPEEQQLRPTLPGSYPDSYLSMRTTESQPTAPIAAAQQPMDRLSESPVHVSPVTSNPPALMGDTSSQEDRSSPISSPSPELVDITGRGHQKQDSMTSTSATTTSTWNDTNLRAFFDSGSDIRDLLVVVYDKTDTPPAGPDHPVVGTLFREQNAKLAEITTQLDNMLGDWLARKQRTRGTV